MLARAQLHKVFSSGFSRKRKLHETFFNFLRTSVRLLPQIASQLHANPGTLDVFREELKDYKLGKDTIQFPYDTPLPKTLITKIAKHLARDVRENDAKWM